MYKDEKEVKHADVAPRVVDQVAADESAKQADYREKNPDGIFTEPSDEQKAADKRAAGPEPAVEDGGKQFGASAAVRDGKAS